MSCFGVLMDMLDGELFERWLRESSDVFGVSPFDSFFLLSSQVVSQNLTKWYSSHVAHVRQDIHEPITTNPHSQTIQVIPRPRSSIMNDSEQHHQGECV